MKTQLVALTLATALSLSATAAELTLRVNPVWGDESLTLAPTEDRLSFTRADLLLSQFALQSENEKWIEASSELFGFVSLQKNRFEVPLGAVPTGNFQAIRFTVGLPAAANSADPNTFAPEHPLNPQLNNLHWGWQSGYIFLALEGHHAPGEGFLYHLGNTPNAVEITVPIVFDTESDRTVRVDFDLASLFEHLDPLTHSSTHSRPGDLAVESLKEGLQSAFTSALVENGSFRTIANRSSQLTHGTPFELRIAKNMPQVELPADNPLTVEGVTLGKRLFEDPILSHRNTQSCASCHEHSAAFTDPAKPFSLGATGALGKRNSMPLFNLAWHKEFFWDGRASSLREQVLHPIIDPSEMAESLDHVVEKLTADSDYPALFKKAFGSPEITSDQLARALEQFLLTLISQDSRFDQALRRETEFTEQEKRGFELFVTEYDPNNNLLGADCFHCHGGALFTSLEYSNNGLDSTFPDLGRALVTGNAQDHGKFKVPSLRNVSLTAPYMHDGRFETLEEVVAHYNSDVQRSATLDPSLSKHSNLKLELSADDQAALVAFLKTLTDHTFSIPTHNP